MSMFRWPLAWPSRLRRSANAGLPAVVVLRPQPTAEIAPSAAFAPAAEADREVDAAAPFFAWLMAQPSPESAAEAGAEGVSSAAQSLLNQIDAVIASDVQRNALLPRAPQVLPQLMSALRDENYASADIAARISKDAVLAADVIRAANGANRGGNEPVVDIVHAVQAIGAASLRRVIARSVLRPIFTVRGSSLSAMAAPQIWADADFKARLCSALCASERLDPLDGYLAGMLHDTGWTALIRALDGLSVTSSDLHTLLAPATVRALVERRDVLFCKLVGPWALSEPLVALSDEMAAFGLGAAQSPLGLALRQADRLATLQALDSAGRLPQRLDDTMRRLSPAEQACFLATTRPV